MRREGLELHILQEPHMDVTDLELSPILGMGSDKYKILNRFRMDLGESEYFQMLSVIFLLISIGTGAPNVKANQAYKP